MRARSRFLMLLVASAAASCNWAQMNSARLDARLASMIPADAAGLAGIRMDELRATPLYQKMMARQRLTQFDELAAKTGFDPRKDVRELLIASNGKDDALILARGTFHVRVPEGFQKTSYQGYTLFVTAAGGMGLIDETTAVAGKLASVRAALAQLKSGKSGADPDLLARARALGPEYQMWSVSKGFGGILDGALPGSGNTANFTRILNALQNTTAAVDLRSGVRGYATGLCNSEQDAKSLGDAARGLVGMGRLSVPENQPQLLRLWDGIQVEQQQRTVRINVAIAQELLDKLVDMLESSRGLHPAAFSPPAGASSDPESHRPGSTRRPR